MKGDEGCDEGQGREENYGRREGGERDEGQERKNCETDREECLIYCASVRG
jgi:hypothetical protein